MRNQKMIRLGMAAAGWMLVISFASASGLPNPPLPPVPDIDVHIVRLAPPAPRNEIIVESSRPAPEHVWVSGDWHWNGREWIWIGGRWDRPPIERSVWIRASYRHRHGHWEYVPGHWSHQTVRRHRGRIRIR